MARDTNIEIVWISSEKALIKNYAFQMVRKCQEDKIFFRHKYFISY